MALSKALTLKKISQQRPLSMRGFSFEKPDFVEAPRPK
jgi:hypothetical protein